MKLNTILKIKISLLTILISQNSFSYVDAFVWDRTRSKNVDFNIYGNRSTTLVSCAHVTHAIPVNMDFCKRQSQLVERADLAHEIGIINNTFQVIAQELPEEIIHNQKVLDKIRMIVREEIERAQKDNK